MGRWREQATSAKNKTDCERFAAELEAKGERQRAGLEPLLPEDGGGTVAALMRWWIETYRLGAPGFGTEDSAIRKHIAPSELGTMTLAAVRPQHVERLLQAKSAEGLSPQTVNHLRTHLHSAFSKARKAGRWADANPISEVEPRKVALPPAEWLSAEEVRAVLESTDEPLRSLFAVGAYCGLRWGELAALRKRDVEWEGRWSGRRRSTCSRTPRGRRGAGSRTCLTGSGRPWRGRGSWRAIRTSAARA